MAPHPDQQILGFFSGSTVILVLILPPIPPNDNKYFINCCKKKPRSKRLVNCRSAVLFPVEEFVESSVDSYCLSVNVAPFLVNCGTSLESAKRRATFENFNVLFSRRISCVRMFMHCSCLSVVSFIMSITLVCDLGTFAIWFVLCAVQPTSPTKKSHPTDPTHNQLKIFKKSKNTSKWEKKQHNDERNKQGCSECNTNERCVRSSFPHR